MPSQNIQDLFKSEHLRLTPQRKAIYDVAVGSMDHLTADEFYRRASAKLRTVSRATVYNTLGILVRCGVVRELPLDNERVLYDTNPAPHHHLVCEDTGEIVDIPIHAVGRLPLKGLVKDYTVMDYSIVFRGKRRKRSRQNLRRE